METMVALVILTMAIGPLLLLSNSATSTAFLLRDNLTGSGLAQEGVEVVRAFREENSLNNTAFDSGLADGTYRLQWDSRALIALGANPPLLVSNGVYSYSSGTSTKFYRTITITKLNASELRIVSNVSWALRGGDTKNIQVESHLFNW